MSPAITNPSVETTTPAVEPKAKKPTPKAKAAKKPTPKAKKAPADRAPRVTQEHRRSAILKVLAKGKPLTRAAIVQATGVTNQINSTCKVLASEGLLKIEVAKYIQEGLRGRVFTITAKGKTAAAKA